MFATFWRRTVFGRKY